MKHCKFNAAFRINVVTVANELGLEFISTSRQTNSGTLMFRDPVTNCRYSLHESGYVRRYIKSTPYYSGAVYENGYQLNRTELTKTKYSTRTYRLLASPYEQLGILVKSVINYRNNNQ